MNEVLFLSETWYVSTKEDPHLTRRIAPSEHPQRREAITLVGRNDTRTRFTFVVQTFQRDVRNQPTWGVRELEEYNVATASSGDAIGLLDALFLKRTHVT